MWSGGGCTFKPTMTWIPGDADMCAWIPQGHIPCDTNAVLVTHRERLCPAAHCGLDASADVRVRDAGRGPGWRRCGGGDRFAKGP